MNKAFLSCSILIVVFYSNFCWAQYGTVVPIAGFYDQQAGPVGLFGGDGRMAIDTSVRFYRPGGISLDQAGDIFILDASNARLRKIDHSTRIITTIAGNGTGGFSGDGGPGPLAQIDSTFPGQICADASGNCYLPDIVHHRVRKVDHITGKITTIAGNGVDSAAGDGGLAINASLTPECVYVDVPGNIYIAGNYRIRKIDAATGIIQTVAGLGYFGTEHDGPALTSYVNGVMDIKGDNKGNIYLSAGWAIRKLDTAGMLTTLAGNLGSISIAGDGGPAISGTLNYTWGLGLDSTGNIYFSDGTTIRKIDAATGIINKVVGCHLPYFNGFSTNADSITISTKYIWVTPPGNIYYVNDDLWTISEVIGAGTAISTLTVRDTLTSANCSLPATIGVALKGTLTGIASATDLLSVSIDYGEFATNSVRNYTIPYTTSGSGFGNIDSLIGTYTYHIPGKYSPQITLHTIGGYSDITYCTPITVGTNCNLTGSAPVVTSATDSFNSCTSPTTVRFAIKGQLYDTPSMNDSLYVVYQYDQYDTTYDMHIIPYVNIGGTYYFSDTISHLYSSGFYAPKIQTTTSSGRGTFPAYISPFAITNCLSTIPLSGTLYMDANLDCIHEPNEVVLAYWPYVLIDNTAGDTTYGWCNDIGQYSLTLTNNDNYTFIANPDGYFNTGGIGDSLHVSCPASGTFNVTAASGNSYIQDFAFTCSAPAFVNMSVNGWGWGYVPGDTGIVAVWSGSPTGYICDSLYSTITLTLDPLLSYIGMWDGPLPSSIVGNTISWTFATVNDLFDFDAHVQVVTATTAPFGAQVCNTLNVTPTQLNDPDTTNNTYTWCEPVRSSWDPNEKQVSPMGGGPQGYVPMETSLSYIIHFQNTGTAPARNVVVRDSISSAMDISTLQITSSSAPVIAYEDTGNVIRFQFNNINLPDSADAHSRSIGFIAFTIAPKAVVTPGTRVTNDAGIYFDYNPAVVTNTTVNTYDDLGTITGQSYVCVGAKIQLADTAMSGGAWSVSNNNATISQGGQIFGVSAGNVTVSYSIPGLGVTTKVISVQSQPVAGAITGPVKVCIDSTIILTDTVQSGIWTSSNGNAIVRHDTVTGLTAGKDTIRYQVTNACGTATVSKVITVSDPSLCTTGISNVGENHELEIFPNPASTEISIKTNGRTYTNCSITNSIGQVIDTYAMPSARTTINIAYLLPGVYYFTFNGTDGKEVRKFVKW